MRGLGGLRGSFFVSFEVVSWVFTFYWFFGFAWFGEIVLGAFWLFCVVLAVCFRGYT